MHQVFALRAITLIYRFFECNNIPYNTPEVIHRAQQIVQSFTYNGLHVNEWMCAVKDILHVKQLENSYEILSGWSCTLPLLRIVNKDLCRMLVYAFEPRPRYSKIRKLTVEGQDSFDTLYDWIRHGYFV